MKRVYDEKDRLETQNQKLHDEIKVLQENILLKSQLHQNSLDQQNKLHEQSENRWLKLIDQAKQETKDSFKRYEILSKNSDEKIKNLSETIANLNQKNLEKDSQLTNAQKQINQLR